MDGRVAWRRIATGVPCRLVILCMNCRRCKPSLLLLAGALVLLNTAIPTSAIILHPAAEPDLLTWTDRPSDDVVGRWGGNASCVAVSRNCVVTTRHQGGGAGTLVEIADVSYSVAQIWNHDTADLRLAKLHGANLIDFVPPYSKTDESGKEVVIGGYGVGNGASLESGGTIYGYEWADSGSRALRFGTNRIENPVSDSNMPPYISDVVVADFDDLNRNSPTTYECIPAVHDSGGGWFIKDDGIWKLAALTRAVEQHFEDGYEDDPNYILLESWFRQPSNPAHLDADVFDAVQISSYAQWIGDNLPEVPPGDLTGDDAIDAADFAVFASLWRRTDCEVPDWCLGADSEPDGDVDALDLAVFTYHWLDPAP